jgi:FkbM family methyltransferase
MHVPQLTVLGSAGLTSALHRAVMLLLKLLPGALADVGCKLYLRVLRLLGAQLIARTYFGCRMACSPRDYVQSFIILFGTWEPDVSNTLARSLRPGDVMLDVGANVGYDALLGAASVGESGKVIAIEASRRTFELLRANIALNGMESRIQPVNVAASDRHGVVELFEVSETNIGAATTVSGRGGRLVDSVQALPLREILSAEDARRVRLIKIDVEGDRQSPRVSRAPAHHRRGCRRRKSEALGRDLRTVQVRWIPGLSDSERLLLPLVPPVARNRGPR